MRILAIDTSTKFFSLAVSDKGKILAEKAILLEKTLSSSIIPLIQEILKKAKVKLADIDGFVVGLGPGSFTSLRVGLSTVKGLAFATKKPIVGIPSLDAIAIGIDSGQGQVCVISDAKRSLLYVGLYQKYNGQLKVKGKYMLIAFGDLVNKIKGKTIFTGDGIPLYKDQIEKLSKENVLAGEDCWYPQARHLITLAEKNFKEKKYADSGKLTPVYLYPDDCQVKSG